jgi:SAM-dependent methyltransferase
MRRSGGNLVCDECGRIFQGHDGYFDFLDPAKGEPTPASLEQRLMESELVARIYDRVWRPTFVRVVAGKGASAAAGGFAGEFFIHKHALGIDERTGPWLDLSCGPGTFTRALAAAAPGHLVVGIDISKAMLEVAARRVRGYGNVALVRADAHELPFDDSSLGGINNAGALHVYDDPEQVFKEILRVLQPGGVYVGGTFAQTRSVVGRLAARVAGIRRFHTPELRAWLSRLGFADYEELHLGKGLVFRCRKP